MCTFVKSIMKKNIKNIIENAWNDRDLLKKAETKNAINYVIKKIDLGEIRVAEQKNNKWHTNNWVKKAVILYFPTRNMKTLEAGPLEFYDKIELKNNYKSLNVRVVPHAVCRYGAYLAKGVILMPSYVNIGAYVDENTMVDTWATVGSCAQIGKNVHLSGGVGIGGVLEPISASPVIIENNCFIGSRSIIVEGVHIKKEAVIGAGTILTSSTKILDVSSNKTKNLQGVIPERSVVIPGTYPKKFKGGEYGAPCALIIGKRKESTNKKTSLNDALREFSISI